MNILNVLWTFSNIANPWTYLIFCKSFSVHARFNLINVMTLFYKACLEWLIIVYCELISPFNLTKLSLVTWNYTCSMHFVHIMKQLSINRAVNFYFGQAEQRNREIIVNVGVYYLFPIQVKRIKGKSISIAIAIEK